MNKDLFTQPEQLPLNLNRQPEMGRNDFMVSDCNREAFTMIDLWPNWVANGLFLYGPKGCGKTHLSHLFTEKIQSTSSHPLKVSTYNAKQITMKNVNRIGEENYAVIIENVVAEANNEALFHLFNILTAKNAYMLWTAEHPAQRLKFRLPDLQSRLNMLPSIQIKEPDDIMVQMLVVKLFNDKQLNISPDILNYITGNTQRSFAYISDLVNEIDKISLAHKSSVSYKIVSEALKIVNSKQESEPDLFSDIL